MGESPSRRKYPDLSRPFHVLSFSLLRTGILEAFKILDLRTSTTYRKYSEAKPTITLQTRIPGLANSALAAISSTLLGGFRAISQMMQHIWDGMFLEQILAAFVLTVFLPPYVVDWALRLQGIPQPRPRRHSSNPSGMVSSQDSGPLPAEERLYTSRCSTRLESSHGNPLEPPSTSWSSSNHIWTGTATANEPKSRPQRLRHTFEAARGSRRRAPHPTPSRNFIPRTAHNCPLRHAPQAGSSAMPRSIRQRNCAPSQDRRRHAPHNASRRCEGGLGKRMGGATPPRQGGLVVAILVCLVMGRPAACAGGACTHLRSKK
jgi:hypothetical protein